MASAYFQECVYAKQFISFKGSNNMSLKLFGHQKHVLSTIIGLGYLNQKYSLLSVLAGVWQKLFYPFYAPKYVNNFCRFLMILVIFA